MQPPPPVVTTSDTFLRVYCPWADQWLDGKKHHEQYFPRVHNYRYIVTHVNIINTIVQIKIECGKKDCNNNINYSTKLLFCIRLI